MYLLTKGFKLYLYLSVEHWANEPYPQYSRVPQTWPGLQPAAEDIRLLIADCYRMPQLNTAEVESMGI